MFENKVRDLITHVIDPLDGKNDELKKKVLDINGQFEDALRRVSDMEFVIDKVK